MFTEKHLCWSLFLINLQDLRLAVFAIVESTFIPTKLIYFFIYFDITNWKCWKIARMLIFFFPYFCKLFAHFLIKRFCIRQYHPTLLYYCYYYCYIMHNKIFFHENKYTIILTSDSANKSFASYVFLFLGVKFVKVEYTRNVSFKKKRYQSFCSFIKHF